MIDPRIISAGISGVAALTNTLIGSSSNANLNRVNRRWQQRMSQLAYDRQRDLTVDQYQLNKQGMINSGISPAAMQGYNGGSASVSTGTPSPSSIPEYVPFDISSVLAAANLSNQTKIADSAAAKNYADANKANKEAGRFDELTDATIAEIESRVGLNRQQVTNLSKTIPLLEHQSDYYTWLASYQDVVYQKAEATYQSDIDNIIAQNKCSKAMAEERLDLAKKIVDAELELTYAQIYNAKASGQAQLSNAYTNRLEYSLDKSLNVYLKRYYKESSGKLHQESITEDATRSSKISLLENDAAYKAAQAAYTNEKVGSYDVDNAVDNASKVIGSVSGAVKTGTHVKR